MNHHCSQYGDGPGPTNVGQARVSLKAGMMRGAAVFTYSPNCGMIAACSWILVWLSVSDSSVTSAVNVSVPYSTGDRRVGAQVVRPIGVVRGSGLGREDDVFVSLEQGDERNLAEFARLGADRVQDDQGCITELADLSAVRSKLFDDLCVPVAHGR